jgi:iron complex transport system substrate-binding protein
MRGFGGALLALLVVIAAAAQARTVTDSAGRKVEVPDKIERVFAAGPPASILIYMLAPEKMTGWPNPPTPEERPYIAPQYRDLPALGRLTGRGGTANLEVVLKSKPDLILDFGSVRDTYVSLADNVSDWCRWCCCAGASTCCRWATRRPRRWAWRPGACACS